MFEGIIESVRESMPIVHAITNYVTVNDCANIILAAEAHLQWLIINMK